MTGIYEELVGSINNINGAAVKLLLKGRFRDFWKHVNGNFLVSLIAGILISIMSLAKLMTYLLSHLPVPTWAFFFGLIVASSSYARFRQPKPRTPCGSSSCRVPSQSAR